MFSPGPAWAALPRFLASLISNGTCTLCGFGAKAEAVDQARADDDRPAALVAVGENELVQRDPRHARRRWRDRRVFVEDRIGPLALGARADNARSRGVDERLAASGQRIEHGNDRALVIGARRVDDDVGGLRRLRQNFSVIERSQHRLDAARANRIGLLGRANQSGHLMSGGDEMRRDRSADIARRARAKDFHFARPPSLRRSQRRSNPSSPRSRWIASLRSQ